MIRIIKLMALVCVVVVGYAVYRAETAEGPDKAKYVASKAEVVKQARRAWDAWTKP